MKRTVEAEWLDALPATDPAAIASRRDLELLNRLMGHEGILCRMLESRAKKSPPRRIVELGAGDGRLMLRLARHFSQQWKGVELVLVDCKPALSDATRAEFATLGWSVETTVADALEWLGKTGSGLADIIIANLFLHQFEERDLTRLLKLISMRTRSFAAAEPRRGAFPLAMSRMVGLIGCNNVTRHDAPSSVKAGFTGQELSALWPSKTGWQLKEHRTHLFSHVFFAERMKS